MSRKRASRFPCGNYQSNCVSNCIRCGLCSTWFHAACQQLSSDELDLWSSLELDYICLSCRSVSGDGVQFDYLMGMHRLKQAVDTKVPAKLTTAVQRETLFKIQFKSVCDREVVSPPIRVDAVAKELMIKYFDEVSGDPIITTGNGDCLFNAVSLLLYGDESKSVQSRYHTCLRMVRTETLYMNHPHRKSIQCLSPSFEATCIDCAKIGGFSSAWTILALCDIIQRPVRIFYPSLNGLNDLAHASLNTTFEPSVDVPVRHSTISILWYAQGQLPKQGSWYAVNHFVPVVNVKSKSKSPLTYNNDDMEQTCSLVSGESITKYKYESLILDDEYFGSIGHECEESDKSEVDNLTIPDSLNCSVSFDELTDILHTDESEDNSYIMEPDVSDVSTPHKSPPFPHMMPASSPGNFMTNDELLKVIMSTVRGEKSIPQGIKSDVYIVIEAPDDDNCAKNFPDDCGVWDWRTATTVNQTFVVADSVDKLRGVYMKNEQYCVKKMVNRTITYEPLLPQPSSVLKLHRYYTKLMAEKSFKKCITTIAGLPVSFPVEKKMLAIVEYCGKMPVIFKQHGNSKKLEPYIRTDPKILQRAAEMAKEDKVQNVLTKFIEDNSFKAPKSTKQINDKKFRAQKRKREENINSRINIADDVVCVLSELHNNPIIQEVILTKHKKPVVIVYSNQQMDDMIRNCEGIDGSVLGVDRTFNLGRFYVTIFSYKNLCVISNRTNDFPVMFGPCMIHFDAEEQTYGKFFSHVNDKFGHKAPLTIGSDEEKSMTNALKAKFPQAKFLLCTKHIYDNVRRHLEENGACVQTRKRILEIIFGKNDGILYATDDTEFDSRYQNLEHFFQQFPKFQAYWTRFVLQKICNYVYRPLRDGLISAQWTNNNSESMNHKLKAAVNWDRNKFPELIEEVGNIMKNQILHVRCAIYSKGDWRLAPSMEQYAISQLVWHGMPQMDKDRHLQKFMRAKPTPPTKSKYVSASNIYFKCPKATENVGKKPGQRKRPAAERTKKYYK